MMVRSFHCRRRHRFPFPSTDLHQLPPSDKHSLVILPLAPFVCGVPKLLHDPDPPFPAVSVVDGLDFPNSLTTTNTKSTHTTVVSMAPSTRSMAWILSGLCVHKIFHRLGDRNALGRYPSRSEKGFPSNYWVAPAQWGVGKSQLGRQCHALCKKDIELGEI